MRWVLVREQNWYIHFGWKKDVASDPPVPVGRSSSDDRLLVEIDDWEWNLFVGVSPDSTPVEYRFQGSLHYTRGIEVSGTVRAPDIHRPKRVRVWISPRGPDFDFGYRDPPAVGRLYEDREGAIRCDLEASLDLPESALAPTLACLGSGWKYLHLWTAEGDEASVRVTAFSFSRSLFPNLVEWAGSELESD